eukprot:1629317-Alexandrium_andersonii.AAC.1
MCIRDSLRPRPRGLSLVTCFRPGIMKGGSGLGGYPPSAVRGPDRVFPAPENNRPDFAGAR